MSGFGVVELRAVWAGREDGFEVQAGMVWGCLEGLAGVGGVLDGLWCSVGLTPERDRVVGSFEVLRELMAGVLGASGLSFYLFERRDGGGCSGGEPVVVLWADVGHGGPAGPIANTVVLRFETGGGGVPVGWLVGNGPGLVRCFVDAWSPASVVLSAPGSPGGFSVECGDEEWAYALPGYCVWLAESVLPAGVLPSAPYRESYRGGTMIGVDPGGVGADRQVEELIDWGPLWEANTNLDRWG